MMQNDFQTATNFLSTLDQDWANLVATVGVCTIEFNPEREPYEAMVRAVAYQQLHGKAGDAIIKRFLQVYDDTFPTPVQLLATDFTTLRACGFSGRKIETIQGIAQGALSGIVPARHVADAMPDEELIQRLVQLIRHWALDS